MSQLHSKVLRKRLYLNLNCDQRLQREKGERKHGCAFSLSGKFVTEHKLESQSRIRHSVHVPSQKMLRHGGNYD